MNNEPVDYPVERAYLEINHLLGGEVKRTVFIVVCLALSAAAFAGAFWYQQSYGEIQVTPDPIPSVTESSVTVPANDDARVPPADLPDNPRGKPTQLVVYSGAEIIVSMKFGPAVYDSLGWGSQCSKVAYRNRDEYPKPGFASKNRSLITGHVWCDRETYTLDRLREVKKGDRAEVYYSSGDFVVAKAEGDAASLPKEELNAEHNGQPNLRLRNDKELRTLRVSTCDTDSAIRANGHLSENVYVLYWVTSIRYAVQ